MNDTSTATRSVIAERDFSYPPDRIWRALTQPHLIEAWLMTSDFAPEMGHRFRFSAEWGAVDCQVLVIESNKVLSYSWVAMGLESVVTWTLTPSNGGTHLRMEHSGFRVDQEKAFQGAGYGWQRFLGKLEHLLAAAA